jgi:hypothetical protein
MMKPMAARRPYSRSSAANDSLLVLTRAFAFASQALRCARRRQLRVLVSGEHSRPVVRQVHQAVIPQTRRFGFRRLAVARFEVPTPQGPAF